MRAALAAALLALALAPAAAAARPALGLRLAFAPSAGEAAGFVPMGEAIAWHVPVQADALWSFAPAAPLAAGAYGSWGPGAFGGHACRDGTSCTGQVVRAGAQGTWSPPARWLRAAPWLGAAAGWEWAWSRRERLGAATTTRWSGPEVALQGGLAWALGARLALGPYALVGAGRYVTVAVATAEASGSAAIPDRALHAWFHLGVRGAFAL